MDFLSSKENAVIISGFIAALILVGLAVGQSHYDEITVDVNISEATILDVNPNSTAWYGLSIGETSSDASFSVENIGSRSITTIEANVTYNTTNPYGSSNADAFDAGNFIIMNSSNVSDGTFYYIVKREWNESRPDYVIPPASWTDGEGDGSFIKFKSAQPGSSSGLEYFMFTNQSDGHETYNCSNGTLLISNFRHTKAETGDIDFTEAGNFTSVTLTDGSDGYGYGNVSIEAGNPNHDLDFYCVRVAQDCRSVDFFRWNTELDASA
jgi:hypothetical protein